LILNQQRKIFENHLPEKAVEYCFSLWKALNFEFKIKKRRQSKYGDYRFDPVTKTHTVSVNHDLNKFAFLLTYIHEVAHLTTYEKYGRQVKPHGREWKMQFKKLMIPMLREDIYPMGILGPLARHMKNPKATSTADADLFQSLRNEGQKLNGSYLKDIRAGEKFLFHQKIYRKIEVKRTRSLCELADSHRKYLISESAPVQRFKN